MKALVLALLLLVGLAGCAEQAPADVQEDQAPADGVVLAGIVQDARFEPIQGAEVSVLEMNFTTLTGATGRFEFPELPVGIYTVTAEADGYLNLTIPVTPTFDGELLFQMEMLEDPDVRMTDRYKGHLQCASESIIIGGSCDRLTSEYGVEVFDQQSIFDHGLSNEWQTVVVDVVFDDGQPGLDGLRVSVRGGGGADSLTEYEQLGRFHGTEAFTIRLEPGGEYNDGSGPVPSDLSTIVFDVFAQGHGYHAVCDPTGLDGSCFLGLGLGVDVSFELIVSTFYGQPAPEGFTLL